jgi:hypothetical protein
MKYKQYHIVRTQFKRKIAETEVKLLLLTHKYMITYLSGLICRHATINVILFYFCRTDMFIHGEVINPFSIVDASELLRYIKQ